MYSYDDYYIMITYFELDGRLDADDVALGALDLGGDVAFLFVGHPAVLLAVVRWRLGHRLLPVDAQIQEVRIVRRDARARLA